jgi:hypothetical protein
MRDAGRGSELSQKLMKRSAGIHEKPVCTRIYSGFYESKIAVVLTFEGKPKTYSAKLTIEKSDEPLTSSMPWSWSIDCEEAAFHVRDEDGGSATKQEIVDMFEKESSRRWHYHAQFRWCLG